MAKYNTEEWKLKFTQAVIQYPLSMAEAARSINVPFTSFARYAKQWNIYKPNQSGKGLLKSKEYIIPLEEILLGLHPTFQSNKLRIRLLDQNIKSYMCESCLNTTWKNKPIPLELHHINGIANDHRKENLELLCPNCHAFTDTYRGKNVVDRKT